MTDNERKLQDEILARGDLPRHIAIIMDGNGRWAKQRSLPRSAGHNEGINAVREVVRACGELEVEALTLYTFSKENWNRPPSEVSAIMKLLLHTIRKEVDELMENNVKISVIGDLEDLPAEPHQSMVDAVERTRNNTGLKLNLALSYSGRREIIEAVEEIFFEIQAGNISISDLDEDLFSSFLDTSELPDPDLLIRTSGEARISNFLLWQLAYTEIYITPVYWPDFRRKELYKAILDFQRRERRFGQVSEQLNNQPFLAEQS